MRSASHTVQRDVAVDVQLLFDVVVAEDVLPSVLHRWGPIPAVVGTRDLSGPWDMPGSERTVVLGDGSTARERVLVWERPRLFRYQVDSFTSPVGRMVERATGVWEFADLGAARSSFTWTYSFHPWSALGSAALAAMVPFAWSRYMRQCAELTVELALGQRAAS